MKIKFSIEKHLLSFHASSFH